MAGTPDPKPAARIVDRDAGRAKVRSEGACRACGKPMLLTRFHLLPRSLRGDDVDDLIVPVCGSGTNGCHGTWELRLDRPADGCPLEIPEGRPAWKEVGTRIRETLTRDELCALIRAAGIDYVDSAFPPRIHVIVEEDGWGTMYSVVGATLSVGEALTMSNRDAFYRRREF